MKFNYLGQERIRMVICIFLLFIATFFIFHYTVKIREPWFGELSADHHQLTGSTVKFAESWYQEDI